MLVGRDALWEMESVTLVDVTQNIKEASMNLCEECSNDLLHFLMISNKVLSNMCYYYICVRLLDPSQHVCCEDLQQKI